MASPTSTKRRKTEDTDEEIAKEPAKKKAESEEIVNKKDQEEPQKDPIKLLPFAWNSDCVELVDYVLSLEMTILFKASTMLNRTRTVSRTIQEIKFPDYSDSDDGEDYNDVPTISIEQFEELVRYARCLERFLYQRTGCLPERSDDIKELYERAYPDDWRGGPKDWMKEFS